MEGPWGGGEAPSCSAEQTRSARTFGLGAPEHPEAAGPWGAPVPERIRPSVVGGADARRLGEGEQDGQGLRRGQGWCGETAGYLSRVVGPTAGFGVGFDLGVWGLTGGLAAPSDCVAPRGWPGLGA